MIYRTLKERLLYYKEKFPVVACVGVRQCGKSTLLREVLPKYEYVSLEDPDIRAFAQNDPRGFLASYESPCILDEVQRVPELFSYLQTKVDLDGRMGAYILSGSHNFLLMQGMSQSLAGRCAILTLAPLSLTELKRARLLPAEIERMLFQGCYPAIYARDIAPSEYFPSYVQTYIERDVRLLRNIPDASLFIRFVKLLAARSGQVLNQTELSNISGVSIPTVRNWLSVLIQSYVIFELPPFYNNYSKRLVKTSKIFFYDTGLLCHLLGITAPEQLTTHPLKGAIFETMVVSEYRKSRLFAAKEPSAYFWRDSNQNEVDLLVEEDALLKAYEIKSTSTMNREHLKGLKRFAELSGISNHDIAVIYTGNRSYKGEEGSFIRYSDAFGI